MVLFSLFIQNIQQNISNPLMIVAYHAELAPGADSMLIQCLRHFVNVDSVTCKMGHILNDSFSIAKSEPIPSLS